MSEIVMEIRALIDACQTGGAYSGYADVSRLYGALEPIDPTLRKISPRPP